MEKWHYGLLGGTALVALGVTADRVFESRQANATVPIPALTTANTDQPSLINSMNPLLAGLPGIELSTFWTGTAMPSSVIPFGAALMQRSIIVDGITVSLNATATCVTPPAVQFIASANSSFTTQTVIAITGQLTAASGIAFTAGQTTAGTVISAGQFVGFELTNFSTTTASCTVLSFNANVIAH